MADSGAEIPKEEVTPAVDEPQKKVPGKLNTAFLQQKFETAASALSPNERPAPGKLKFTSAASSEPVEPNSSSSSTAPKAVGKITFNPQLATLQNVLAGGPKPIKKEEKKEESSEPTPSTENKESSDSSSSSSSLEHATLHRAKAKKRAPTKKPVAFSQIKEKETEAEQSATQQQATIVEKKVSSENLQTEKSVESPPATDQVPVEPKPEASEQSSTQKESSSSPQSAASSPASISKTLLDSNKIGAALIKQLQAKQNNEIIAKPPKSEAESDQKVEEETKQTEASVKPKQAPVESKSSSPDVPFSQTDAFLLLPLDQQQKILLAEQQAKEKEDEQKVTYYPEKEEEYKMILTQGIEITQYKPKAKERFLYVSQDGICYWKDVDKKGRNKHTPEEDKKKDRWFDLNKITEIIKGKEHSFFKENRKATSDAVYSCCFSLIGEGDSGVHLEAMSGRQAEFLVEAFCYFWKRPRK